MHTADVFDMALPSVHVELLGVAAEGITHLR